VENYKLADNDTIIRLSDNAYIPTDSANRDYAEYLEWKAEGNTPDPADLPPAPTWLEKRQASVAGGGYGAVTEQLEIIGEQGVTAFQDHIAAVKAAIPKP
tara:strand:+ start:1057 stop:1356 length:300 start_codon:yes stop_codon:yes gene_type:complete